MGHRHCARGVTIIELTLALVLLALLAAYAATRWPGYGINLAAQSAQLAGDLRYTQSLSMTRGQRYRINFAADRYWLSTRDGATLVRHPAAGAGPVLLPAGMTLSAPLSFLVFDRDGAPYTDAALPGTPLATDVVLVLDASGESRSVRLSPETGRVVVQ